MILFKKPSRCKCGGTFRQNVHAWVVIHRRKLPQSSHLKCLQCGWKWWSTCKYVARLRDHKERSFQGMTDEDILSRINDGSLIVDTQTGEVVSVIGGTARPLRVIDRESRGSSYQFVEVCLNNRKKKIAVHRLVWMAANRRCVPDGYDVDHIGGKAFGNGIKNLRLLEASKNRSRGKPAAKQSEVLF